jgi:uncharacterized protein (TIGR01244 family)
VGDQPTAADLEKLKKGGVTTVVNLRLEEEEGPLTAAKERALAEGFGLEYHHLPISFDKLDAARIKELREILKSRPGPAFVHCGTGQRACSLSLAASGLDADSIFEESAKLGFPVWDQRLRVFLKSQRIAGSREKPA